MANEFQQVSHFLKSKLDFTGEGYRFIYFLLEMLI